MDEPRIVNVPARTVVGMRRRMTLSDDRTFELWRGFRPRICEIESRVGNYSISIQVFDGGKPYENLGPDIEFERWAAVEVSGVQAIPDGMESRTLASGEYAIFIHRGLPAMFFNTFQFIFGDWFPRSGFELDRRDSFEILGEKYDPFDINSEEEIWMPILRRGEAD